MLLRIPTLAAVIAAFLLVALATAQPSSARPFETAVFDHLEFPGPDRDRAFAHVRAAGATAARIGVAWANVAPPGTTKPANFDAR